MTKSSISAVAAKLSPATTGAPEVEITAAMLRAGVREFCAYDPDLERPADIVPEIFKAMLRARSSVVEASDQFPRYTGESWVDLAKEIHEVETNNRSE
jgi:hypothetical protein